MLRIIEKKLIMITEAICIDVKEVYALLNEQYTEQLEISKTESGEG